MSLFSIVQGRAAPQIPPAPQGGTATPPPMPMPVDPNQTPQWPPMPAPAMPPVNPMQGAPTAPVTGFIMGGLQDLPSYEYAPRPTSEYEDVSVPVPGSDVNIPGYEGGNPAVTLNDLPPVARLGKNMPANSIIPYGVSTVADTRQVQGPQDTSSHAGYITTIKQNWYAKTGQAMSDATAEGVLNSMNDERAQQQADALSLRSGGSGPDHFYEQLAYNTAKDAADRADQQRMADAGQVAIQQKAISDWHQAQLAANNQRQQTIAGVQNNNTNAFMNNLEYLSASNGPHVQVDFGQLQRNAEAGYGPNPDPAASDLNMPNIPGYVFTNPNGGQ